MAALDPTAAPEADEEGNIPAVHRSTLKIIRVVNDDEGDDEDEDEYLQKLLGGGDDEESDEESDEEANGGPSDPAKSKKAKRAAAIKKLMEATQEESDEEMEDVKPNGKKGKAKAKAEEESDEESDEDDEEEGELEEFVVCTLDTERVRISFNQPKKALHRLTSNTDLPAAHRPCHWRGREGLLRRHRYPHCLRHWQLRGHRGRGGRRFR